MKVLVTGFDAFGGAAVNASELVVNALAAASGVGVVTAVLPTSYRKAEANIQGLIHTHKPDRVLMLGLARRATAITLEQAALNIDDCGAPDNDGEIRLRQRISEDAPAAFWNSLPLDQLADIARELGHEVEFSRDAGGFICNHVFFSAARTLAADFPESQCGFVHLPPIAGPGRRLTETVALLQAWIDALQYSNNRPGRTA